MAAKSGRFYWIECDADGCEQNTGGDEGMLAVSAAQARTFADLEDFHKVGKRWLCAEHYLADTRLVTPTPEESN